MYAQVEKSKVEKSKSFTNPVDQKKNIMKQGLGYLDNRVEFITQIKAQENIHNGVQDKSHAQLLISQQYSTSSADVIQKILDISSSPKSQIGKLKYNDFKSLNKRFGVPVPAWLSLKDMSECKNIIYFKNWNEVISLIKGVRVDICTLPAGTKLYKGGELNIDNDRKSDWSGCYLTEDRHLAEGYGDVTTITVKIPLKLYSVKGEMIGLGKIPSYIKSNLIKSILNIPMNKKLIPYLGDQGAGYEGLENEEGEYEVIVPWGILKQHFSW